MEGFSRLGQYKKDKHKSDFIKDCKEEENCVKFYENEF